MKIRCGKDFERIIKEVTEKKRKIIFFLGDVDTGKTTLSLYLAKHLQDMGFKVAMVDSDVGQSTISPPATVGLKINPSGKKRMDFDEIYFTGDVSPRYCFIEILVGTKKMIEEARKKDCDHVIVDSCGYIAGTGGRRFKYQKIDLIQPDLIIALEKKEELELILETLGIFATRTRKTKVFDIVKASREQRIKRRRLLFEEYFSASKKRNVLVDKISFFPHINEAAYDVLKNSLVGLKDSNNRFAGLGIIQRIKKTSGELIIQTPCLEEIAGIVIGRLKINNIFEEEGRVEI